MIGVVLQIDAFRFFILADLPDGVEFSGQANWPVPSLLRKAVDKRLAAVTAIAAPATRPSAVDVALLF